MTTITSIKIKSMFGEHGVPVLTANNYIRRCPTKGRVPLYECLKSEFPGEAEFNTLRDKYYTTDLRGLVDDAFDQAEEIKDELQNWIDSMPENLQNSEKASTAQDAIEAIDNALGYRPDDIDDVITEEWKTLYLPNLEPKKSRNDRIGDCAAMLRAAVSALESEDDKLEKNPDADTDEEKEELEIRLDNLRTVIQQLEDAASELEGV